MHMSTIGRYEVISEIARGGMATVYLARDPRFNRDVAVKALPRAFTHDPQFLARFKQEAEAIASLEHQYVVPVYDFGEEDDQPYLVMRYMAGGSLKDRIERGPMSVGEAIAILRPIAAALDYAHARGIVHRDVKPGNILFDQSGGAYLSDFGIVKLAEATASFTGNAVIGTPAYMSPEQIQGGADIDGRTDIYALGITLYEMLAGEVPYKGETTTQQLMKHILEPVPRLSSVRSDVPPNVEAVLARALAKDRDSRYASGAALVRALEQAQTAGHTASSQPATEPIGLGENAPQTPVYATMLPPDRPPATEVHEIGYEPLAASQPSKRRQLSPYLVGGVVALLLFLIGGGTVLAMTGSWRPLAAPALTSTPTPTPTMAPTEVASPTPTLTPEPTPTSTLTPSPTPNSTSTPTAEETPTPTPSPTATPTQPPPTATWVPPTPTSPPATPTTPPPTATPTVVAGPLSLSHNVDSVSCVPDKTYMVRFSLYVGGGTGQHAVYRDVDSQVVYPLGSERAIAYELEWGRGNAAVGTFYARSGDQRAETKFYVPYPDCSD